ncbi:hypothetical protein JX266_012882 [Neoarthrinium moseri]|nr:hypothetical protein JX266_012882 [Neoarthrinium moseri]
MSITLEGVRPIDFVVPLLHPPGNANWKANLSNAPGHALIKVHESKQHANRHGARSDKVLECSPLPALGTASPCPNFCSATAASLASDRPGRAWVPPWPPEDAPIFWFPSSSHRPPVTGQSSQRAPVLSRLAGLDWLIPDRIRLFLALCLLLFVGTAKILVFVCPLPTQDRPVSTGNPVQFPNISMLD